MLNYIVRGFLTGFNMMSTIAKPAKSSRLLIYSLLIPADLGAGHSARPIPLDDLAV